MGNGGVDFILSRKIVATQIVTWTMSATWILSMLRKASVALGGVKCVTLLLECVFVDCLGADIGGAFFTELECIEIIVVPVKDLLGELERLAERQGATRQ